MSLNVFIVYRACLLRNLRLYPDVNQQPPELHFDIPAFSHNLKTAS
jgi:hypothetical protein